MRLASLDDNDCVNNKKAKAVEKIRTLSDEFNFMRSFSVIRCYIFCTRKENPYNSGDLQNDIDRIVSSEKLFPSPNGAITFTTFIVSPDFQSCVRSVGAPASSRAATSSETRA
jgi:hypothetical protein